MSYKNIISIICGALLVAAQLPCLAYAEETITITVEDKNFYNYLKGAISCKDSADDENQSLTMTNECRLSVTAMSAGKREITSIKSIENFTNLQRLHMDENSISDISPLKDLTSITYLDLYDNRISDISYLEKLTELEVLQLDSNEITDISVLSKLKKLNDKVYLDHNQISDISALPEGDYSLALDHNKISDLSRLEEIGMVIGSNMAYYQSPELEYSSKTITAPNVIQHVIDVAADKDDLELNDCGEQKKACIETINASLSGDRKTITIDDTADLAYVIIHEDFEDGEDEGTPLLYLTLSPKAATDGDDEGEGEGEGGDNGSSEGEKEVDAPKTLDNILTIYVSASITALLGAYLVVRKTSRR